jgi:hypothetical protein
MVSTSLLRTCCAISCLFFYFHFSTSRGFSPCAMLGSTNISKNYSALPRIDQVSGLVWPYPGRWCCRGRIASQKPSSQFMSVSVHPVSEHLSEFRRRPLDITRWFGASFLPFICYTYRAVVCSRHDDALMVKWEREHSLGHVQHIGFWHWQDEDLNTRARQ